MWKSPFEWDGLENMEESFKLIESSNIYTDE